MKQAALISVLNTIIPFGIGILFSHYFFGFDMLVSVILGIALSVSSQAISLDILDEFRMVKSKVGTMIIAGGAIDDIFELVLISGIIMAITTAAGFSGIFHVLRNGLAFIIIIVVFRTYLVPFIIDKLEDEKNATLLFGGAVIISLLIAGIADYLGLDALIGALVAGVLVKQTFLEGGKRGAFEEHNIAKVLHILAFSFFVPIFFVSVGLSATVSSFLNNIWFSLLLTGIGIFGTVLGSWLAIILSKGSSIEGWLVGWGVTPKGDVELVIATLALQNYLITVDIYSAIIFMAILTTIIGPIVFRFLVVHYYKKPIRKPIKPALRRRALDV